MMSIIGSENSLDSAWLSRVFNVMNFRMLGSKFPFDKLAESTSNRHFRNISARITQTSFSSKFLNKSP